jgi:hypothetical protein
MKIVMLILMLVLKKEARTHNNPGCLGGSSSDQQVVAIKTEVAPSTITHDSSTGHLPFYL